MGGGHRQLPGTSLFLCTARGPQTCSHSGPSPPRFAHQFLDPGTYVFRDNGLPESIAVVLVKEKGVACDPGLSPVQPSSPYQLARHGVLRHRVPNLGPDWAAISGADRRAGRGAGTRRGRGRAGLQPVTLGIAPQRRGQACP